MQIFNLKIIVPHFGYCDINKWKSITVLMTNTPYYVPRPWPVNLCSDQYIFRVLFTGRTI